MWIDKLLAQLPAELLNYYIKLLSRADFYKRRKSVDLLWQRISWDTPSRAESWKLITTPMRPSTRDLDFFREKLKEFYPKRVLILGSTPEFRDLVASLEISEVYLIDFSINMLAGMTQYLNTANPDSEIWVKCNWLQMPFQSGFFDIILGDFVLQQIPETQQDLFLAEVRRVLKNNGAFITRLHCLNPQYKNLKIDLLVQEVLNFLGETNKMAINSTLRLILYDRWSETKPSEVTIDKNHAIHELKSVTYKYPVLNSFVKELENTHEEIDKFFNLKWWIFTKEKTHLLLKSFFLIMHEHHSDDYFGSSFLPILVLKKNKKEE